MYCVYVVCVNVVVCMWEQEELAHHRHAQPSDSASENEFHVRVQSDLLLQFYDE